MKQSKTLKYGQGHHRQSYHLKAVVWFLIGNFCGRIVYNFRDIGRWNDTIGWNDLQMSFKVIERGTNWKLVLPMKWSIVTFAGITHRFRDTRCFNYQRVSIASYANRWYSQRRNVCPSVCLSVRASVTLRYCIKTKKASVTISSPSESLNILVF